MTHGWRVVENANDWMRNIERRLSQQERRPPTPTAHSLLGPGFGPRAVQITDWNSETALFNGMWYSEDALNAPTPLGIYLGLTISGAPGHMVQVALDHASDLVAPTLLFTRRAHAHTGRTVAFSPWAQF